MNINEACMKECRIISNVVKSTYDVRLSNTESLTVMPSKCSANKCMHWRWIIEPKQVDVGRTTFGEPIFETQYVLSTTNGYCGLCGKDGAE